MKKVAFARNKKERESYLNMGGRDRTTWKKAKHGYNIYDVSDVHKAECNLEPLKCRKCGSTKNVIYLQYVGDAQCEKCGAWQGDYTKAGHKRKKLRSMV